MKQVRFVTFYDIKVTSLFVLLFIMSACVQSGSPSVTELITTLQPTINGQTDVSLSASSAIFTISGTCDLRSYGTEYSTNGGSTWTDLGSCTGTYSFTLLVTSTLEVLIRGRTQFAYTPVTRGRLRLQLPPSTPIMTFVAAGVSPTASITEPKLNATMPTFMTGTRSSGTYTFSMDIHPTGVVYAQ